MKKTTLFLASTMALSVLISCQNSEAASSKVKKENVEAAAKRDAAIKSGAASASFDKLEYDFGEIQAGEIVETTFKITNSGKTDLVIIDAKTTCGCTVPQWPKEAIKPGETKDIQVKFNSRGKRGRQSKNITLMTNTASGREVIKIKGFVATK